MNNRTIYTLPEGTAREFKLRKKSGGYRNILAPSKELKAYQKSKLKDLEDLYQKKLNASNPRVSNCIHGFLSNRSVVTAAKEHLGYDTTISMDIQDYFDQITKSLLITTIIKYFGTRSTFDDPNFYHPETEHCAQGFVTSPILSTIYSVAVVEKLLNNLDQLLGENNYALTMYADDLSISYNNPSKEASKNIIDLVTKTIKEYQLEIKPSKTRIRHASNGARRILGVNVYKAHMHISRKAMRKLRAAQHQQKQSVVDGLLNWKELTLPKAY